MLPQRRGISAAKTSNVARLQQVGRICDKNQRIVRRVGNAAEHSVFVQCFGGDAWGVS
jgi:mRNA degradation ribonuclease J1/J2